MTFTKSMAEIAIKSGMIEGQITRLKILKSERHNELEKALDDIKKWAKDIQQANKNLTNEVTERLTE